MTDEYSHLSTPKVPSIPSPFSSKPVCLYALSLSLSRHLLLFFIFEGMRLSLALFFLLFSSFGGPGPPRNLFESRRSGFIYRQETSRFALSEQRGEDTWWMLYDRRFKLWATT